jgi:hypothetical protein
VRRTSSAIAGTGRRRRAGRRRIVVGIIVGSVVGSVVGATDAEDSHAYRSVAAEISDGTWTVGVDIEPATCRTKTAVPGGCYREITRSRATAAT